jgi:PAS domain S-box-containing protein
VKQEEANGLRKFGVELVGDVPWGTHLCQFYETKEDLIDILVPYFAEGLSNNEFCMWVTSLPLEVEEAKQALRKAVPELDQYIQKGQIEVLPYTEWYLLGGAFDSDRVLQGWIQKEKVALSRGFVGLRLTGNTFWLERNGWKAFTDYEEEVNNTIGKHRMIAVCTYSLSKCNANEVIDVVKNHQFALIKRWGKWELIESSEAKKIQSALLRSEEKFFALYSSMIDGVAFHDVVYDSSGKAVDYMVTDVNPSYEKITGLSKKQVIGKRASELYGTGEPPYLDIYAKVASSGKPASFETYFPPMQKHFRISVFSPSKGKFTTVFHDITQHLRAEEALRSAALFPEQNPFAVLRVARDGTLLYANKSSARLLDLWDCQNAQRVPEQIRQQVAQALDTQQITQLEVAYGSVTYSFVIAPIAQHGYANLYGNDITERKKAEDAMRKQAALINLSPDGIMVMRLDGTIAFWSQGAEDLYGWTRDEVVGHQAHALLKTIFLESSDNIVSKLRGTGRWSGELAHQTKDGREIVVQSSWLAVLDKQGEVTEILESNVDITERKKVEEELQNTKNYLENLIDYANAPIIVWNPAHHITRFNHAFERLTGHKAADVLGKPLEILFPEDSKEESLRHIYRASSGEYLQVVEIPILRTDRDVRTVLWNSANIYGEDGTTVVATIAQGQDITERKQMQSKLENYAKNLEKLVEERTNKLGRSELYARSLIEASLDPLVTINVEGKITDVNKATELATGCSREKLIGSDFSEYFTEPEKARIGYKKVFAEGFVRDYPLAIKHKSGKTTDVLYNASIYRNTQGEPQGVFAAARDITERKKAEEKAQESAKKLKDAERLAAIGATAGMVGHDIRNPLQSIIGDVYLAKMDLASLPDSKEKESLQESLEAIGKQTEYINKIVLDLQDFAKPLNPHAEETDIEMIINDLLVRNGVPKNIQTDAKVDIDAKKVMADSAYMKRILGNLFSNAVQAMPNGGKLTVRAYREAGDVVITVEDTGMGIPEEAKPKLFQPLFTTKSKGQGFGLSVVKRLTEALNGTITFKSQEGKGTKFAIRFPSTPKNR